MANFRDYPETLKALESVGDILAERGMGRVPVDSGDLMRSLQGAGYNQEEGYFIVSGEEYLPFVAAAFPEWVEDTADDADQEIARVVQAALEIDINNMAEEAFNDM